MADYYYEARKHDKWLRKHAKENKARKERMKQFQRAHSRDHHQSLIIEGRPCKLYRDPAAGAVVEGALMPWNGRRDVLIDRFDARAVLDMVPLSPKGTGDHREKKGLETFLSFERYRGIVDAQRVGLGEKEHALAVSKQVEEKLSDIARFKKGEPDAAELAAAKEAQDKRNKKAETKAAIKEAKNAGVHGHYGPGAGGLQRGRREEGYPYPLEGEGRRWPSSTGATWSAESLQEGEGEGGGGEESPKEKEKEEQDEDEAQLDPEILALIEKEVGGAAGGGGGGAGGSEDDSSDEESDFTDDGEDEDDGGDDDSDHKNADAAQALSASQDLFAEDYGISEKRSGYSYSRLLRYERRHRAQHRANRMAEVDAAKKRKKPKKKADGTPVEEENGLSRPYLGSSLRDSPTYEDFGDPLEARRQKRREDRERAGGSARDAAGNGAGRGRQYISSFEISDSKAGGGKSGSGSDGSLLGSESEGDEGGGSGGTHLVLLQNFFPTLADTLRRHLEKKEEREKELEAERARERERDREREIERARRRAAARRRRSRSTSSSRSSPSRRRSSRDRDRDGGSSSRRSRRDSRSRSSGRDGRSSSRREGEDRGRSSSGRGRRGGGDDDRDKKSARSGRAGGGGSKQAKPPPKADKKLTPMEMMKLRMRKALDSQLQKDKTAIAKKSTKDSKMAELDRKQQQLDEEQHERLQARARAAGGRSRSRSRSGSRSPPHATGRRRHRSRSRSSSSSSGRHRYRRRRDDRDTARSGSSSGSRSRSVPSHRWPKTRSRSRLTEREREPAWGSPGIYCSLGFRALRARRWACTVCHPLLLLLLFGWVLLVFVGFKPPLRVEERGRSVLSRPIGRCA